MDLTTQEQSPNLQQYPGTHVATRKEAGPLLKIIGRMLKPKVMSKMPKTGIQRVAKVTKTKKVKYY